MYPIDHHLARESAHKRIGKRQRQSEAEHRLYWSTYRRAMASKASAPHNQGQVWKCLPRLLGTLRRWWFERVIIDKRVGDDESRKHLLISEQKEV